MLFNCSVVELKGERTLIRAERVEPRIDAKEASHNIKNRIGQIVFDSIWIRIGFMEFRFGRFDAGKRARFHEISHIEI